MNPIDQGVLFILAGSLGFLLSRLSATGRLGAPVSFLNVWVALPGIFFVLYLSRGILSEDAGIATFSVGFTLVMLGLLVVVSRGMPSAVRGSVILSGAFVNAVNLPFPILQVTMGTYSYAATFAATISAIQIVAARVLQQRLGTGSGAGSQGPLARAAPLVALGAGVLFHYLVWPSAPSSDLLGYADLIENALIAVIFLHFGFALGKSLTEPGTLGLASRPFLTTALSRCVGGPLLALLLALPFGTGSPVYLQMVFVATMPPAIINTLISRVYGFDANSTARWTTVLTPLNTAEALVILYAMGGFH